MEVKIDLRRGYYKVRLEFFIIKYVEKVNLLTKTKKAKMKIFFQGVGEIINVNSCYKGSGTI